MSHKLLVQLAVALCLVLTAGVGNFVAYGIVRNQAAQIGKIQQQIQLKTIDTTKTAFAKSQLASLSADEATIDQYFVSTGNVVPFLEGLQTTGKFFGSTVQVVSVSADDGTPYGYLNLSVSITGSFDGVMRTIGAIEYEPYDTTLKSLTLDGSSGTASSSRQWTATAVFAIGTQTGQSGQTTPAATTTP